MMIVYLWFTSTFSLDPHNKVARASIIIPVKCRCKYWGSEYVSSLAKALKLGRGSVRLYPANGHFGVNVMHPGWRGATTSFSLPQGKASPCGEATWTTRVNLSRSLKAKILVIPGVGIVDLTPFQAAPAELRGSLDTCCTAIHIIISSWDFSSKYPNWCSVSHHNSLQSFFQPSYLCFISSLSYFKSSVELHPLHEEVDTLGWH